MAIMLVLVSFGKMHIYALLLIIIIKRDNEKEDGDKEDGGKEDGDEEDDGGTKKVNYIL